MYYVGNKRNIYIEKGLSNKYSVICGFVLAHLNTIKIELNIKYKYVYISSM